MIEPVCDLINSNLAGAYFERKAGAVTRVGIKEENKTVYFPFDHATANCTKNNAVHPDERYKMVTWMEAGEVRQSDVGGFSIYEMPLRFIGWLNLPKLGTRNRALTGQIESDIINQMKGIKNATDTVVTIVSISFERTLPKDLSVFSKYSFKEDTYYFFGDFDYFAHQYTVRFTIDCQEIITSEIC